MSEAKFIEMLFYSTGCTCYRKDSAIFRMLFFFSSMPKKQTFPESSSQKFMDSHLVGGGCRPSVAENSQIGCSAGLA